MKTRQPYLTSREVVQVIFEEEGVRLPLRTLAHWCSLDLVRPSVRWDRRRGRAHPTWFSASDFARVRLIVRLRRVDGLTMQQIRVLLASVNRTLTRTLAPDSDAVFVLVNRHHAVIRRHLGEETGIGQFRLPLSQLFAGTTPMARPARRVA